MTEDISRLKIRECATVEELSDCVSLQKEVFALPDIEISPVRHFIVTKNAGGWTLGAYLEEGLVGFVLSVPAFLNGERAFYSHMTAVKQGHQGLGIGAALKWAQRERSLSEGVKYIKWTFQPVQARNAFFNLEKLGAIIRHYSPNFYGTDYSTAHEPEGNLGIESDRLFAEWRLEDEKVAALATGGNFPMRADIARRIAIPSNWASEVASSPQEAAGLQSVIRKEFEQSFAEGMICRGFDKSVAMPEYLLYED